VWSVDEEERVEAPLFGSDVAVASTTRVLGTVVGAISVVAVATMLASALSLSKKKIHQSRSWYSSA
jgi:hypothetical protein